MIGKVLAATLGVAILAVSSVASAHADVVTGASGPGPIDAAVRSAYVAPSPDSYAPMRVYYRDDDWRAREWREREWRRREWREREWRRDEWREHEWRERQRWNRY
jgi:hypothetical protein